MVAPPPTSKTNSRVRWFLAAILVVALALRLLALVGAEPLPGRGDAQEYDQIARHWLASGRYTTPGHGVPGAHLAIRTPGYPALLAGLYWTSQRLGLGRFGLLRPVQLLVDLASLLLVYALGRRLFGRRVGLGAAACYAFYPPLLQSFTVAMTETVSVLLVLITAHLLLAGVEQGRGRHFAAAGVVAGLAILVRPLTQLLGWPVLALAGLAAGWRRARGWLWGAAFLLALALTLCPWLVRNRLVFGRPAPLSTYGGINFFTGNYLPYRGYFRNTTYHLLDRVLAGRHLDEVATDAAIRRAAWRNIAGYLRHQPLAYAGLVWQKFRVFWDCYFYPVDSSLIRPLGRPGNLLHRALLLLALPGLLLAGRRWRRTWPVLLLPAYLCLVQVAIIAEEGRYNIIAMPFVMVLACCGALYLFAGLRQLPVDDE